MNRRSLQNNDAQRAAPQVLRRIQDGGERVWIVQDFAGLPFSAVAQALSRLTRKGQIQRLSKGVYYRPRATAFGKSRPNPAAIQRVAVRRRNKMFPSGIAAANLLGFTTQNPLRKELATTGLGLPRKLVGSETIIHTRRPEAWANLSEEDAALLDFLRRRGESTELPPERTIERLLGILAKKGRFERLVTVSQTEPPRVRAMLGALGEQLGKPARLLNQLRAALNPLSRFDFGVLVSLPYARHWQAKERP